MNKLVTQIPAPTIVTEGSRIQGDLTFLSATQIHGVVEGDVHQEGLDLVSIGRTGWVKGSVQSTGPILVEGRIDGNITSAVKISLSQTASVHGVLTAPTIEVRPGAVFEGDFNMKVNRQTKTSTVTKRAA